MQTGMDCTVSECAVTSDFYVVITLTYSPFTMKWVIAIIESKIIAESPKQ